MSKSKDSPAVDYFAILTLGWQGATGWKHATYRCIYTVEWPDTTREKAYLDVLKAAREAAREMGLADGVFAVTTFFSLEPMALLSGK